MQWAHFIAALKKKGMARIDMQATIEADGALVARFAGRYVAMRP